MTLKLEVQDQALRQRVDALLKTLTDPAPLMAGISQEMLTQTEARIQQEGPGWPQLKPATVKRRGSAHPILQVTGALARSFTPDSGKDYAMVSSNDPRAPVHFFGAKLTIPARSQRAYFKQDNKTGDVGNLFVKKSKSNFAQWVTMPAYEINIPARPMLPVDENGNLTPTALEAIMEILTVNFEDI